MRTAVQLRSGSGREVPKAELIAGDPCTVVDGRLGQIALFDSGEIVAYRISYRRRTRTFMFRTLDVDDRLAASVPGVKPRVELLLHVHSATRAALVRGVSQYLAPKADNYPQLPDAFYLRAAAVLGVHLSATRVLRSLVESQR
jgi:hypothetical protein